MTAQKRMFDATPEHAKYALREYDAMIERDGYRCHACGIPVTDRTKAYEDAGYIGYRIPKNTGNIKKYGLPIIDSRYNIGQVCKDCLTKFISADFTETATEISCKIMEPGV